MCKLITVDIGSFNIKTSSIGFIKITLQKLLD